MIASNFPDSASRRASSGISKAPGTLKTSTCFSSVAQTFKRVERALNQTGTDEVVPTTGDNRKTKSLTVKMTFVNYWLQELVAPFERTSN